MDVVFASVEIVDHLDEVAGWLELDCEICVEEAWLQVVKLIGLRSETVPTGLDVIIVGVIVIEKLGPLVPLETVDAWLSVTNSVAWKNILL